MAEREEVFVSGHYMRGHRRACISTRERRAEIEPPGGRLALDTRALFIPTFCYVTATARSRDCKGLRRRATRARGSSEGQLKGGRDPERSVTCHFRFRSTTRPKRRAAHATSARDRDSSLRSSPEPLFVDGPLPRRVAEAEREHAAAGRREPRAGVRNGDYCIRLVAAEAGRVRRKSIGSLPSAPGLVARLVERILQLV